MTASLRYVTPFLSALVVSLVSTMAAAHSGRTLSVMDSSATPAAPRSFGATPMRLHLAEVEIVNTPQSAPAAAPAAPVAAAPVAAAPVVAAPVETGPRKVSVNHHQDTNYMSTIAVSALMGALAGGLIGGSLYFLSDDQNHAQRIAYWAAGGVLVGTGVGLVQIMVQEGRASESAALRLPSDPAPTFRLALLTQKF